MIRVGDTVLEGCPFGALPSEAYEAIAYHGDWEAGHSPVTTGRAPWLPAPFLHAMHAVRNAINEHTRLRTERQTAKFKQNPPHVTGRHANGRH